MGGVLKKTTAEMICQSFVEYIHSTYNDIYIGNDYDAGNILEDKASWKELYNINVYVSNKKFPL